MRRTAATLLFVALLWAALAGHAQAAAAQLTPCRLHGVAHEARCGSITRALDPSREHGPTVELHFAVLPALARQPAPDPVVFIAGGPGQSAIELAGPISHRLGRLGRQRDIVLVDQRGTGRSAPLRCDDDAAAGTSLREQLEAPLQLQRMRQCLARLQALPWGDLRHYGTSVAMADLDAVRQALGAERINLVAASYGTRAALEYLRLYPRQVRRMVLDGVVPADMALPEAAAVDAQAAFDALLQHCANDEACRRRHPQLPQRWQAVLATLPRELRIAHPLTGQSESVWLSADALAQLLRAALYAPATAAALPAAIDAAARSHFEPLVALASALSPASSRGTIAQGMHFAVVCSEDLPRQGGRGGARSAARAAPPQGPGGGLAAMYHEVCAFWPRGELPAGFTDIVATGAPVLLLSGGIDPATPPRHGERVARALGERARHVVVPQAGHGVLALPCIGDAVEHFIEASDDAQALRVDTGCARDMPRATPFVPPAPGRSP